jgi:hypothetical protein
MDRETAMTAARAYLAGCIELEPIPEEEVEHLNFYCSGGHRQEFHFFYYRGSWQRLMVGGSSWIAVSRKTGKVAGMGECGE